MTTIFVIGHSLNEIDLPYFHRIVDSAKDALWKVSYYSENEKESHIKALMSCGVSQEKIVLCSYEEL